MTQNTNSSPILTGDRVIFMDDDDVVVGYLTRTYFDARTQRDIAVIRCPRGTIDDVAELPYRSLRRF